jgi:hypothetical protein
VGAGVRRRGRGSAAASGSEGRISVISHGREEKEEEKERRRKEEKRRRKKRRREGERKKRGEGRV